MLETLPNPPDRNRLAPGVDFFEFRVAAFRGDLATIALTLKVKCLEEAQ